MIKRIFLVFIFCLAFNPLFAENIVLKSGESINGKIVEKTDKYIKIDFDGASLTYFPDDIKTIDGVEVKSDVSAATAADFPQNAQVPGQDVVEKARAAQRAAKMVHINKTEEMEVKGILSLKAEETVAMDIENRVLHITKQFKDYNLDLAGLQEGIIQKKIAEAKEKGTPPEKIKQMEQMAASILSQGKNMMGKIMDTMKKTKYETFIINDDLFFFSPGGWLKMNNPSFSKFWEVTSLAMQGKVAADKAAAIAGSLPGGSGQFLSSLLTAMERSGTSDFYQGAKITETDFSGQQCYKLDIDSKNVMDILKNTLLGYMKSTGKGENLSTDIKNFSYAEFISKDNYLKLGTQTSMEMVFLDTKQAVPPLVAFIKTNDTYGYPKDISVPREALSTAKVVKDENELRNIIAEQYKSLLGNANQ